MCSVSAVHDYFHKNVPVQQWTPQTFGEYQKIIALLEKLDEKMNQPHCDDPAKAAWMNEVEKRLSDLENKEEPDAG